MAELTANELKAKALKEKIAAAQLEKEKEAGKWKRIERDMRRREVVPTIQMALASDNIDLDQRYRDAFIDRPMAMDKARRDVAAAAVTDLDAKIAAEQARLDAQVLADAKEIFGLNTEQMKAATELMKTGMTSTAAVQEVAVKGQYDLAAESRKARNKAEQDIAVPLIASENVLTGLTDVVTGAKESYAETGEVKIPPEDLWRLLDANDKLPLEERQRNIELLDRSLAGSDSGFNSLAELQKLVPRATARQPYQGEAELAAMVGTGVGQGPGTVAPDKTGAALNAAATPAGTLGYDVAKEGAKTQRIRETAGAQALNETGAIPDAKRDFLETKNTRVAEDDKNLRGGTNFVRTAQEAADKITGQANDPGKKWADWVAQAPAGSVYKTHEANMKALQAQRDIAKTDYEEASKPRVYTSGQAEWYKDEAEQGAQSAQAAAPAAAYEAATKKAPPTKGDADAGQAAPGLLTEDAEKQRRNEAIRAKQKSNRTQQKLAPAGTVEGKGPLQLEDEVIYGSDPRGN
jgi:hypothetical protein